MRKIFKLSKFKIKVNKVYNLRLISYNHHFRDKAQILNLKNIEKFKEIKLIDTSQFVSAFKKIKISLRWILKKQILNLYQKGLKNIGQTYQRQYPNEEFCRFMGRNFFHINKK